MISGEQSTPGRRIPKVITTVCSLLIPALALAVHPYQQWEEELGIDPEVSYDGTRIMTIEGEEYEIMERRAPRKMYTEFHMGGMSGGMLLREDLETAYMLMPSMGMYREMDLADGLSRAANGMEFENIEPAGTETINGHTATKYKTRFRDENGKGAGFIWVTETGVPIKMDLIYSSQGEKGQRITSEMVELNIRPQDPGSFELPPGLAPMNMGNMAGFAGFGQGQAPAQESDDNAGDSSSGGEAEQAAEDDQRELRERLRSIFKRKDDD